ncbi:Heme exporter protein A [Alcanivorax hongdengensis A-11-3]|uniref:Heme exporter protein A n=1 Tax=Alcanivorax hongdengensis A-11-3 TaxID=1177179 RepID=L0WCT0_9GAMM|nr:Heme exporter protein A [Alcanivorax hongdengensis A-11-3]
MLTLASLACERDDRVLFSGLTMQARAGEIWQITGANGAGKTTLLRILVGLHGFYEGRCQWAIPRLQEELLYLGHQPGIREELSAEENLRFACALNGQAGDLMSALQAVGLRGFEDVPAAHLSAGQKRRIALARLWLSRKRVWVLDEPYTAIDQHGVESLDACLQSAAGQGTLVIYTSHHRVDGRVRRLHLAGGQAEVVS